jgi:N-acetylmuramoyl-L-alanine amidase
LKLLGASSKKKHGKSGCDKAMQKQVMHKGETGLSMVLKVRSLVHCLHLLIFMAFFCAHSSLQAAPIDDKPVVVAGAQLILDQQTTKLSFTLSRPAAGKIFLMERPDRVILDLPEMSFQLPRETGRTGNGVIASFRYGLFAPQRSRIIIDLAEPALVSAADIVPGTIEGSHILTLSFTKTDRETFRKAVALTASAAEDPQSTASLPRDDKDRRPLIMLDPGHGGIDSGAVTVGGVYEKDVVFAFASRLKTRLEASGRYKVMMTRDQDVFVPLNERVRRAREARADLFVSIHADSISAAPDVRGLTVYTSSEKASDAESARLADRENKADANAGLENKNNNDEVADILQDLMQRETRGLSQHFARKLTGEVGSFMRLNVNPHRQAGFVVLRAPDVPSILVELGYLSSKKDIDLLTSDAWRDKSTAAMAQAIDRFFALKPAERAAIIAPQ